MVLHQPIINPIYAPIQRSNYTVRKYSKIKLFFYPKVYIYRKGKKYAYYANRAENKEYPAA